jgi:hypothetical protein
VKCSCLVLFVLLLGRSGTAEEAASEPVAAKPKEREYTFTERLRVDSVTEIALEGVDLKLPESPKVHRDTGEVKRRVTVAAVDENGLPKEFTIFSHDAPACHIDVDDNGIQVSQLSGASAPPERVASFTREAERLVRFLARAREIAPDPSAAKSTPLVEWIGLPDVNIADVVLKKSEGREFLVHARWMTGERLMPELDLDGKVLVGKDARHMTLHLKGAASHVPVDSGNAPVAGQKVSASVTMDVTVERSFE